MDLLIWYDLLISMDGLQLTMESSCGVIIFQQSIKRVKISRSSYAKQDMYYSG